MILRFVCPACQVGLEVRRNGVGVETMSDFGPYQYWHGDLLACPSCGLEIISNFGEIPKVCHYEQPRYQFVLEVERQKNLVFQAWYSLRDKDRCLRSA